MTLIHTRTNTAKKIADSKLVAIIRLANQYEVADVIDCLVEGGVTTLEVTANTPGYCEAIQAARKKYPEVLIGAGTITNKERLQLAINAGAQFIVTPNTKRFLVEMAHANDLPVLMGALTPTDIAKAISYKADFIKVFPAGSMGIQYFNDIQGPFSDVPLMPVGGVNVDNIREWFDAGAIGVGVGNDLTKAVYSHTEKEELIRHVKRYVAQLSNSQDTGITAK